MSELSKEQHDLLRDVLVGDRELDDAAVLREAQASPGFAERLEELAGTSEALHATHAEMQRTLDAAAQLEGVPGEDRVREHVLGGGPADRSGLGGRWIVLLAAGLLLALSLALWPDPPAAPDRIMMGNSVELVRPLGTVERYSPIAWKGKLPSGGTFVVSVWNVDGWIEGDPLPESPPVLTRDTELHEWELSSSEMERLADQIVVEITCLNREDGLEGAVHGSARR